MNLHPALLVSAAIYAGSVKLRKYYPTTHCIVAAFLVHKLLVKGGMMHGTL
jgi:hypothetical protein